MHNPIFPGFTWRQAFDFPPGFLQAGDTFMAQFRASVSDPEVLAEVQSEQGMWVEDDRLFVELTPAQTEALKRAGCSVVTSFVMTRLGEPDPIAIGLIITIPVSELPTRVE